MMKMGVWDSEVAPWQLRILCDDKREETAGECDDSCWLCKLTTVDGNGGLASCNCYL